MLKVFVYFNLHKKVFSIKALSGPNKGKVIAHSDCVELSDVTFKVSEAGRQRVLRERSKNVHAGVVGYLQGFDTSLLELQLEQVTYNPYKYSSFVMRETEQQIKTAEYAVLTDKKIFI